jgi:hypothetical protein
MFKRAKVDFSPFHVMNWINLGAQRCGLVRANAKLLTRSTSQVGQVIGGQVGLGSEVERAQIE